MTSTSDLARARPSGTTPAAGLDAAARADLFELAASGMRGGNLTAARDLLQGLVVLERENARAWAMLGRVERDLGNLADAREALAFALALAREDWDTALDLAEVQARLGEKDRAQGLLSYVTLNGPPTTPIIERVQAITKTANGEN